MMSTFHIIHIIIGIWLAIVNFTPIMIPTSLAWNNIIIGIIVASIAAFQFSRTRSIREEGKI